MIAWISRYIQWSRWTYFVPIVHLLRNYIVLNALNCAVFPFDANLKRLKTWPWFQGVYYYNFCYSDSIHQQLNCDQLSRYLQHGLMRSYCWHRIRWLKTRGQEKNMPRISFDRRTIKFFHVHDTFQYQNRNIYRAAKYLIFTQTINSWLPRNDRGQYGKNNQHYID